MRTQSVEILSLFLETLLESIFFFKKTVPPPKINMTGLNINTHIADASINLPNSDNVLKAVLICWFTFRLLTIHLSGSNTLTFIVVNPLASPFSVWPIIVYLATNGKDL